MRTPATINLRPEGRYQIALRRVKYLIFRVLQYLGREFLGSKKPVRSVCIYPPLSGEAEVADVLNRIACSLGRSIGEVNIVVQVVNRAIERSVLSSLTAPSSQGDFLSESNIISRCIFLEENDCDFDAVDLILLWNSRALWKTKVLSHLNKVLLVDKVYYLAYEPYNYAHLKYLINGSGDQAIERNRSLSTFTKLYKEFKDMDHAYVLVTGPSLDKVLERPLLPCSLKIICNSIVKNEEILKKIQPDILVFSDPVFHFGPSKYATEFRRLALRTLQLYPKCYCIVPEVFAPFLKEHLKDVAQRIVGIPHRRRGAINFPIPERFYARVTDNIMTFLMLPLAASLAREVHIIGADGRQKTEKYYWKHNPSVQFGDLMDTAFITHPSFTRDRNYADYYDKHCRLVESMITKAERKFHTKVISDTASHIPALSARSSISP